MNQPEKKVVVVVAGSQEPWVGPLLIRLFETEKCEIVYSEFIGIIAQALKMYPNPYAVVMDPYTGVSKDDSDPAKAWGMSALRSVVKRQKESLPANRERSRLIAVSDRLTERQVAELTNALEVAGVVLTSQSVEVVIKQILEYLA